MSVFSAHVEKGTVVLDEPMNLPDGAAVVVISRHDSSTPSSCGMQRLASLFPKAELADIEAALKDCRSIDLNGW